MDLAKEILVVVGIGAVFVGLIFTWTGTGRTEREFFLNPWRRTTLRERLPGLIMVVLGLTSWFTAFVGLDLFIK